jgi:uncharacterized protein involved in type VI secretion and phage assembly
MMDFQSDTLKYGGLYRGVVVDNDDPSKFGRIKVQVFGVYTNIPTESIPWAVLLPPVGCGAGNGYGVFSVPDVGSYVFVMFEGCDPYQPVCVGSAPDGVHGLPSDRTTNYPNRRVIKSTSGIVIYIDDTATEMKVVHPAGAYIKIDSAGNVTIQGTKIDLNP